MEGIVEIRNKISKETIDQIERVRALNRFMETGEFYGQIRQVKDLLYQKQLQELALLQTNGKLCEWTGLI